MVTTTLTLADFLLARFAEEEAIAREALCDEEPDPSLMQRYFIDCCNGAHVHMNPGRLLADVEAKREIVAMSRTYGMAATLQALAAPYADHSDYRPEWRP